jgi:hypothetical protein
MAILVQTFIHGLMRRLSIVMAVLMILLISPLTWAATQNAVVTGYVYDQNGAAVPGAIVRLINASTGFTQARTADDNGSYTFPSVPPAAGYLLSVEMRGFAPEFHADIEINVGDYRDVEPPFVLRPLVAAPAVAPSAPAPAPTAPTPTAPAAPTPTPSAPAPSAPAPPPVTPPPPVTTKVLVAPPPGAHVTQGPTLPLDISNTMMGGVIDSRLVRTLPLANRDFFELALLVPGTYPVEQGSPLEGASLIANGIRANMNNFLLDGVDNNDYTINQALPFQIVEAMQEFRVQTAASTAEYGRNGGAQVNTISRTGLNNLHGSLFEFNRNSALSNNDALSAYSGGTFDGYAQWSRVSKIAFGPQAYNPNTGLGTEFPTPVLSDPTLSSIFNGGTSPHFNQNQFGGNLGGPIVKNKAFFFFNWESLRADDPRPVFERVPDSTCRSFTACNADVASIEKVLPTNTGFSSTASTKQVDALLGLYPAPNVPASTVTDSFGLPVSQPQFGDLYDIFGDPSAAFYTGQSQNFTNSDNALTRIDIHAGDRVSMSFKHNIQRINQVQGGSIAQTSNYPGNGITVNGRNQNFSYNFVDAFTDRNVNEFRVGWNRFRLTTLPLDHSVNASSMFANVPSGLGLPSVLMGGYDFSSGPYANLGAGFAAPSDRADSVTSVADNLSLTRGRHIIKFGGEFRHDRLNVDNEGAARGLVAFDSPFYAELEGVPAYASIARVSPNFASGFDRSFHANSLGAFVQDDWRAQSNLTVTLGVRYEVNQAPLEARNRLVNDYPYSCQSSLTGEGSPVCLAVSNDVSRTFYDSNGTTMGTAGTTQGTATFIPPAAGFNTDWKNFAPRVGLAWHPLNHSNTVFRAGYALMYDQMSLQPSVNMLLNPPTVQQTATFEPALSDTFPAGFPLTNNCAAGQNIYAGCWTNGAGFFNLAGQNYNGLYQGVELGTGWYAQPYSITARDPNTRTPYVHQIYAGIEQRLGNKAMFEVAYVGTMGHKLLRDRLLLECTGDVLQSNPLGCSPRQFANPVLAPLGLGFAGLGTESDSVINQETSGASDYHSLQARLDTRAFHGLTLHVHYMWAHSIDNASATNPPVFLYSPATANFMSYFDNIDPYLLTSVNNANPTLSLRPGFPSITTEPDLPSDSENSADLSGQRANSDFDIRQRAVIYYIYDLPKVSALRGLGNGWQVAGITDLQTGQPFSVYGDFFGVPLRPSLQSTPVIDNTNPNGAIDNAMIAGCNVVFTCSGASGVKSAFNTNNTFTFQSGSLGRNSFFGPRLFNFDFSVLKNVYIGKGEDKYFQFRAEFFNLFNRTNYRQPFSQEGQFESNPDGLFEYSSGPNAGKTIPNFVVPNPFFGQILQTFDPRTIQFGLKFIF